MTYPANAIAHWSTEDVPPSQRVEYWNDKNTSILIGLNSSSFDESGLFAMQTNFDLDECRLADIQGNQHVIERTPDMVRRHPKSAVFASLVLQSNAFFYQGKECFKVEQGDLILYDTTTPYLFGFTENMRQILFDIPSQVFSENCIRNGLEKPLKIRGGVGAAGALVGGLRHRAMQFVNQPCYEGASGFREDIYALLQTMVADHVSGSAGTGLSASYLMAAKTYVSRHLQQHSLSADQVAKAVGISTRHLNRVFADENTSVAKYIRSCRLRRARDQLSDAGMTGFSVAEIAYKWGFPSQAHFSRVFRDSFGITPTDARGG